MHLVDHACPDPNESCNQQRISGDTGVCKCKTGYIKRSPTDSCMQTRTVTTPEPHSDNKPTTPGPEHVSKLSGNDLLHCEFSLTSSQVMKCVNVEWVYEISETLKSSGFYICVVFSPLFFCPRP
jgi:hypothetical protein